MKRKFLKVLTLVMSVVMLCASLSSVSMALSYNKKDIPSLENHFAYSMLSNDSQTIAFFAINDNEEGGDVFAYTSDGVNFNTVDFSEYFPPCDYYEVASYSQSNNVFAFFIQRYDICEVYDEVNEEYYDEYIVTAQSILTTKDFETFEEIKISVDEDSYRGEYELFFTYGFFGFVDDTLYFCNGDFITTGSDGEKELGRGVYYTTDDLKTWESHYTQEEVIIEDEEFYEFCYFYSGDSITIQSAYPGASTYLCTDGELYGPVNSVYGELDQVDSIYNYSKDHPEYVVKFDTIYTEDFLYGDKENADICIKAENLSTGEETVLYQGEEDFYFETMLFNGDIYITTVDYYEEDGETVYVVTDDLKLEEVNTDYSYANQHFSYFVGKDLYVVYDGSVVVYTDNLEDALVFDISEFIEDAYYIYAFEINGKLYIIESFDYAEKTSVYTTDADLTKTGDVNGDGKIDSSDALRTLQGATGLVTLSEKELKEADTDGDGAIKSADALKILQYATGRIHSI